MELPIVQVLGDQMDMKGTRIELFSSIRDIATRYPVYHVTKTTLFKVSTKITQLQLIIKILSLKNG